MNELQYMEFSLFGHPFKFRWPRQGTALNPLDISDVITAENAEAYVLAKCAQVSHGVAEFGTQYGLYSVVMAKALPPGGKLVGLEILPFNAQISNENLKTNGLSEKGIVLHAAASDADGYDTVMIDVHRENASLLGAEGPIHGIGTMDVPRFSFARLRSYFGPFDMIKMDVEGYEGHLIQTMDLPMAGVNIAAIEIHPHSMHSLFGKTTAEFMGHFDPDQYCGFMLVGSNGCFTVHDLGDESALNNSVTVNAFFFRKGVHDDLASVLRQSMETMGQSRADGSFTPAAATVPDQVHQSELSHA